VYRFILNNSRPTRHIPPQQAKYLLWLLYPTAVLFAVGLVTPMLTISKFVFLKNSFSVFSGVVELFQGGQYILCLVVAGFSIVLPALKLHILYRLLSATDQTDYRTKKYLHLMHEYGRWAMLDVMIVAVLLVTVRLGAIATVQIHSGLYIFAAAVLLIMLITHKIVQLID
jgi:paraquat-inducible protein A